MSVRLILDTSALCAYVADDTRALAVGELITNVQDNRDSCGIPALCLLAALKQVKPNDRPRLLRFIDDEQTPTVVLPVMAPDIAAIATLAQQMPDAHAQAAVEQAKHEAFLGTYERLIYTNIVGEDDILDL